MTIMEYFHTPFRYWYQWNELFFPDKGTYEVKFSDSDEPVAMVGKPVPAVHFVSRKHSNEEKMHNIIEAILSAVERETYLKLYDDWYKVEADVLETKE